jgi:hypothetical protein
MAKSRRAPTIQTARSTLPYAAQGEPVQFRAEIAGQDRLLKEADTDDGEQSGDDS